MAIDPNKEDLLSLTEATKVIPPVNSKRLARSTLWRWCRKGLRGIHLDYVRVGRDIATSREAMSRFFVALAEADEPLSDSQPSALVGVPKLRISDRAQQKAIERAERRLAEAGV